jgi:hypothetical protein
LECRSSRVGDVYIMMPSLLNIYPGRDDAGKHHATDFVYGLTEFGDGEGRIFKLS